MNSLFMLTFSHVLSQVAFFKTTERLELKNPRDFEYLAGVHCFEVLAFCFRCAMKIPVQSRQL
ncbi:hypothetical protein HanRHA438_Chr16g0776821 [Helianthus annuus]|nr:hypothetical protein HanRHA438_Chr16g0776821 [Helianthus annuus]